MTDIISFLSDFTLRNVMLGAALLGISSGILGCFALLRQQSLLGDTLSHAALPGIALGFLISGSRSPLPIMIGALITGGLAALWIELLVRRSRLKTDAAMGIALSIFFALGIVLLTFINSMNNAGQAGLDKYLFGQAAAILPADITIMMTITLLTTTLVVVFWKELKITTFDSAFAASLGFPVLWLQLLMTAMIALAIVIGLQMVGVVLMASMIIAPAAAARQWTKNLEVMAVLAAIFGALSGIIGAVISASGKGLATGPLIVIAASVIVILSLLLAPHRGLLWAAVQTRRHHADLQSQQVLLSLYKLAQEHNDPSYPSEVSMVNIYYGVNTGRQLKKLEAQGLINATTHMSEEGQHYQLTESGYKNARTRFAELGGNS